MIKLVTTSVIRSNAEGHCHGGVYLVDLESQEVRVVIDWDSDNVDWRGGVGDHGLRGIAIDGETVYIVASDVLLAFTPDFKLIDSWRNPYLKQAGEMSIYERNLYITSAAYDSILAFELDEKKFSWALHIDLDRFVFTGSTYDPTGDEGPLQINKLHLNNVHANDDGMYIAGLTSGGMLHFNGEAVYMSVTLPEGTHNARPFRDGVLFIDTEADAVRYASRTGTEDRALKLPTYTPPDGGDAAPGFGRGLCLINDRVVAAGSSPSTVSLNDLQESKTLLSVGLTTDIRNSIHSIALWPF